MSVYFVAAQGLIKIGYSANAMRRVDAVLSPFADGGEILGILPGDRALEAFFHGRFEAHRSHGEWFYPHKDIISAIEFLNAPKTVKPDKQDDRTLVQVYEETYAENAASALHAARAKYPESIREMFFDETSKWSGISARRLNAIYRGDTDVLSAAEYTIIRGIGEGAGHHPSMNMDGVYHAPSADSLGGV